MMLLHLDPPIDGGSPAVEPVCGNPYDLAPDSTVSESEIGRYFDREMTQPERDGFLRALRTDAAAAREVALTREVLARLDEPVGAPDLTGSVLRRVGRARGFLGRRQRRLVTAGRASVLVAALLTFGVVLFARERAPELDLSPAPMPVSRVVEAGRSGLAELATPAAPRRAARAVAATGLRTAEGPVAPPALRWSVDGGTIMRASYAPETGALAFEPFEEAVSPRREGMMRECWFVVVDGVAPTAADLSRGQWRGTMWINSVPLPRAEGDLAFER